MGQELVRLLCPNLKCRTILSVPAAARGRMVRCRQCGGRIAIPVEKGPAKPQAAATASDESSQPTVA